MTIKQIEYLKNTIINYRNIAQLNNNYSDDFKTECIKTIGDILNLANKQIENEKRKTIMIINAQNRLEQIAENELFWNTHISPSGFLIDLLKNNHKRVPESILRRYHKIADTTMFEYVPIEQR